MLSLAKTEAKKSQILRSISALLSADRVQAHKYSSSMLSPEIVDHICHKSSLSLPALWQRTKGFLGTLDRTD
jgi:hypothetical protein